jgi:tRNA threonylcarbamoyladenosine modification (KEOPS) complex  Pcc1 subunit
VKNLQATITLEYPNQKTAQAVAKAISPDNLKTPQGLQIKTLRENTKVITEINCENKLSTFTATIDDLLFCASTAEKALKTIEQT